MPVDHQCTDFVHCKTLLLLLYYYYATKGTLANRKYSFKGNGMKNKPIVKTSRQFLEGIIIQRSDRQDATHHACTV